MTRLGWHFRRIRNWRNGNPVRQWTCPCGSMFFTLPQVSIDRHPTNWLHSRLSSSSGVLTCTRCDRTYSVTSGAEIGADGMSDHARPHLTPTPAWVRRHHRKATR